MAENGDRALITAGQRGLVLQDLDQMYRFATAVIQAKVAPKGVDSPATALVAIQMGAEVGLPPMASIQNIAVINGRPSIWGDAALAVCMNDPRFVDIEETVTGEGDKMVATCKVWRKNREQPVVRTFSMADAKKAGLAGKPGPWQQFTARMLQMRARAFALRDTLPGALRGMYFAEEVQDMPAEPRRVDAEVVNTGKGVEGFLAKHRAAQEPDEEEPVHDLGNAEPEPEEAEDVPPEPEPDYDGPDPADEADAHEPQNTREWREAITEARKHRKITQRVWDKLLAEVGSLDGDLEALSDEQAVELTRLVESA